jgi:hypothetical protein
LAVPVKDNGKRVFMNCEYLIKEDLDNLFSINILGDRKQVDIATKVIKNYKNKVTFLVT